jgi:hypothetical protein
MLMKALDMLNFVNYIYGAHLSTKQFLFHRAKNQQDILNKTIHNSMHGSYMICITLQIYYQNQTSIYMVSEVTILDCLSVGKCT